MIANPDLSTNENAEARQEFADYHRMFDLAIQANEHKPFGESFAKLAVESGLKTGQYAFACKMLESFLIDIDNQEWINRFGT